ncbi:MAG: tyrosine-protein phosphatase [Gordonia sp. (in: high G+C Gram-positive bacteria)]
MTDTSTTPAAPGAPSPIAALPNLRDLGGWIGADGRVVKYGLLFRSTDFRSVAADAESALSPLGLRTIYDLRSAAERSATPDPKLQGVADVSLDVLADEKTAIPGNLDKFLTDPETVAEVSHELSEKGPELIEGTYRGFITLGSATSSYRSFYRGLLGEKQTPALFHCTTGKDRTGWAAASFLSLMGVSRTDVYDDYLLTNSRLLPALAPVFDKFAAAGGDPAALRPLLGVDRTYLDAAFAQLEESYGTVEDYFAKSLGIDHAEQQVLRDRYLAG